MINRKELTNFLNAVMNEKLELALEIYNSVFNNKMMSF